MVGDSTVVRPLGARVLDDGLVEFRVWAPRAREIALRLRGRDEQLSDAGDGFYEAVAPARAGDDYLFVLDGRAYPDPCSRWQPEGLRGTSRVVWARSPARLAKPPAREALVIQEVHVGTFTAEGTFEAAIPFLGQLAALGVTAIELMPVAEFPGARGWGYDGVYISAAQSSYGGPLGLLALVEAAHREGLAVILDVVYNHVGASGVKALEAFGPYFTEAHETPWGRAIDYSNPSVREWVAQSADGWVRDFGLDGLRLDAIHSIYDSSPEHIVAEVVRRVHDAHPGAVVIGEIGLDDPHAHGGDACDAIWVDDFHHALHALLTGERDGYYEHFGGVADLAKAFGHTPPGHFVVYAQNHDQIGNRAFGDRLGVGAVPDPRPLAAFCTLLSPFVPLMFMGEEYGEQAPFQFFSDHIDPEIAQATRDGRREEFASFAAFHEREIPDPQDVATFMHSKLTRERDPALAGLYEGLLAVRRELSPGDVDAVEFDEGARWLRVRRGRFELVMNFGSAPVALPCPRSARLMLSTSPASVIEPPHLRVAPLSGALLEVSEPVLVRATEGSQ